MEDRETPRIHKYGERKTTRIMMATVRHVTSSSGLRKFQTDGFCSSECTINLSSTGIPPSSTCSGTCGPSSVFSGVSTGEEVDEAGDQGSEDTTTVNVQILLEAFLKTSLISTCFVVELFACEKVLGILSSSTGLSGFLDYQMAD